MKKLLGFALVLSAVTLVTAHPHFRKTVTADLPGGVKATISYQTVPANESHAQNAQAGTFVTPRRPVLTLSGQVQAGSVTLPAGDYTIGVIKNSSGDWTLALHPGQLGRGDNPDMSKVIKLDSLFSNSRGTSEHLVIDITPGHGKFEGKAVLTIHFGTLFLDGALS